MMLKTRFPERSCPNPFAAGPLYEFIGNIRRSPQFATQCHTIAA
jgi:hypothetical protein